MNFAVYELQGPRDRHRYVGFSANPYKRLRSHFSQARHGAKKFKLYAAIRKYGEHAFSFRIRGWFETREEALLAERILIAAERPELNLTAGGEGVRATPEVRAAISASNRGKRLSEETRAKIRAARARQTARGLVGCGPFDEVHRAKIRAAHLGRKQSEETKAKRSASLKRAYAEGRRKPLSLSGRKRGADGKLLPEAK